MRTLTNYAVLCVSMVSIRSTHTHIVQRCDNREETNNSFGRREAARSRHHKCDHSVCHTHWLAHIVTHASCKQHTITTIYFPSVMAWVCVRNSHMHHRRYDWTWPITMCVVCGSVGIPITLCNVVNLFASCSLAPRRRQCFLFFFFFITTWWSIAHYMANRPFCLGISYTHV